MPRGVEVQVLSSAQKSLRRDFLLPCRLMVGQQPLELFIVVRIHAGQLTITIPFQMAQQTFQIIIVVSVRRRTQRISATGGQACGATDSTRYACSWLQPFDWLRSLTAGPSFLKASERLYLCNVLHIHSFKFKIPYLLLRIHIINRPIKIMG